MFATADANVTIAVKRELSLRTARRLCQVVDDQLQSGAVRSIVIDLEGVRTCDVAGLAVLCDTRDRCAARGVRLVIVPGPDVFNDIVRARLVESLPLGGHPSWHGTEVTVGVAPGEPPIVLARSGRLTLRVPAWDELMLFEGWAADAGLEGLVGSDLLYDCRHRGSHQADVTRRLLGDATSVTVLLEVAGHDQPVGYLHLFGVSLVQRLGFLEVVVGQSAERQRGWGILGARMLIKWALDVLGLHRIEAKAYARNRPSNHALHGSGFTAEGRLREASANGEGRDDLVVYGILAPEARQRLARDAFPPFGLWGSTA